MAFKLIQSKHKEELIQIILSLSEQQALNRSADKLSALIEQIRDDIPEKKRISFGRGSIIRELGTQIFLELKKNSAPIYEICSAILDSEGIDYLVQGAFLQTISYYGLDDLERAWPYLKRFAAHEHWEMREFAAGWVGKLLKKYPAEMKREYIKLTKSEDHKLRRLVPESLRPVKENKWFHKNPEYPFSIIRHLFKESKPYPRTSVGNSLSDWMRIDERYAIAIVKKLVANKDKNSYWIAYRACRNLVKREPIMVMNMLDINEYKYKSRIHRRIDFT